MDLIIQACGNKDLSQLLFNDSVDLELCLDTCVHNDFPEGLRFLLKHSPKCIRPIVEDSEVCWTDPHLGNMIDAVQYDLIECMRAFLDHGCDPNGDIETYSPFFSVQSIPMAELLLSHGADINPSYEPDPYDDPDIQPPLFSIICERLLWEDFEEISPDRELILFLIDKGLQCYPSSEFLVRLLERGNFNMLQFFYEKLDFDLNVTNHRGENLLFDVVLKRNVKGVTFLLERGVQNTINKRGQTPLTYATEIDFGWPSEESHKIVELIRSYIDEPVKEPGID